MDINQLKSKLKEHNAELKQNHKVASLKVFGSVARGEQTEKSDVDLLVYFSEETSLLDLFSLNHFLEDILGCKVDLITEGGLKHYYKQEILKEAKDVA